ncbi:MAG: RagB/SusD family nutrient uptake outer membrane protein [Alistipes sp.]
MKYIIKTYILLLLATSAASCEGFLEKYPESSIPAQMTTVAETVQVDYGIFSCFKNPSLYSGTLTLGQDLQSDLVYAFEGYTNAYGQVYRWDLLSTDAEVEKVYAGFTQAISRCNFLLDNADALLATLTAKADIETVKKCMGDAHFARALGYSELLKVYSKAYPANDELAKDATTYPGVSLVLTYDDSQPVPMRSSLYDSYQQVLKDLEKAAELLKTRSLAADNPYFTTGTVNALYARTYLYMRNYQKAAEYATKVIDSKVYTLADANKSTHTAQYNDYRFMWLYDSSDEIIWKVSNSYTDRGGALGQIFLGFDYAGHYRADFAPCSWVEDLYTGNDYRYAAFFMQQATTIYGHTATLLRKYAGNPEFDQQAGQYLYTNMPKPFRLAEQYLIRAEANYYLKNETDANKDLTTLRRARIAGYGSSSTGGTAMLKEIRDERVRELMMEGFRLSDLKRYGEGFTRKPQKGSYNGPDRLTIKASNPLFTWPIPQHEIDAVPGMQGNESNQ